MSIEEEKIKREIEKEIEEINDSIVNIEDYSDFDLADDIERIENGKVRVALMLHYIDRLHGIPDTTDYIVSRATEEEKKEILEVFKREGIPINRFIFTSEFKDTIMAKITKGAVMSWGENDEKGEWFAPTEEQAEATVSEGGLVLEDGKVIDYSSKEKATNGKTYGSEVAAIEALTKLVLDHTYGRDQYDDETLDYLIETITNDVYTQPEIQTDVAQEIRDAFEQNGVEKSIIEILRAIHDNWVKDNGNKFDDPNRAKKLHQFVDLRLMTFGDDGATADLLFLQPILEGAGIEVDQEKLKAEFEKQQKEYMAEKSIDDVQGLKKYLSNLEENYPPVKGVTTNKGKTLETPVEISTELANNQELLERMTSQVSSKLGIEYEQKQDQTVEQSIPEISKADIAEADKSAQLTTNEVGRIRRWIEKIKEFFKGKGEK